MTGSPERALLPAGPASALREGANNSPRRGSRIGGPWLAGAAGCLFAFGKSTQCPHIRSRSAPRTACGGDQNSGTGNRGSGTGQKRRVSAGDGQPRCEFGHGRKAGHHRKGGDYWKGGDRRRGRPGGRPSRRVSKCRRLNVGRLRRRTRYRLDPWRERADHGSRATGASAWSGSQPTAINSITAGGFTTDPLTAVRRRPAFVSVGTSRGAAALPTVAAAVAAAGSFLPRSVNPGPPRLHHGAGIRRSPGEQTVAVQKPGPTSPPFRVRNQDPSIAVEALNIRRLATPGPAAQPAGGSGPGLTIWSSHARRRSADSRRYPGSQPTTDDGRPTQRCQPTSRRQARSWLKSTSL